MSYTVIIAHDTKRDRKYLDACLASIRGHTEIIVSEKGNVSEARNRAALEAGGEILVFFDDDTVVRKHCLEELIDPFSDPKVGIVGGVNINFQGIGLREQVSSALWASPVAMFRSSARWTPRGDLRQSDESELTTCVFAVRKSAFMKAGGFPVDIIPCEENVLINRVQRAGWKILYNPFAVVYHRRPRAFLEYWQTIYRYGRGRGTMIRRGEGGPRMVWRPSRLWLYYAVALIGHYVSYLSGVFYGMVRD